ncbi:MAG: branched-chain amino acid aminotransferase [Fibrobacteres bacterium]|nr:branched-chain amino acid aminotransferase [Fibrobacterota bacterium]
MSKNINWDDLSFAITPTDVMYRSVCGSDGNWDAGEYLPYGNISISPAAGVLNYGQGLFEGLKALRTKDNKIVLFRPIENGKRLEEGAKRICMPPFPVDRFVEVAKEIVKRNADYVPPYGKGSLYLRPCLWGTGAILGVAPAPEYTFMVYVSPVGPYFKTGFKPIKLVVTREFQRAAGRGTGNVKYIGNYAGTMYPAKKVKADGYNECIYLDAKNEKYIEEVGAANFFCIKGNKLMTPALGSILPGITRKSVLQIAKDKLGMEVVECPVSVDDALAADEAFCSGTAAVISSIGNIVVDGKEKVYCGGEVGPITRKLYDMLTKLQLCEESDPYGWVVEVK